MKLWEVNSGKERTTWAVPSDAGVVAAVSSLAFTTDGKQLAAGAGFRTNWHEYRCRAVVWDLASAKVLRTLALVSLLSTTVGPYSWWGAVTERREGGDGIWTVQLYCATTVIRERNGDLSHVHTRTVYTDAKARDPPSRGA